MTTTESLSADSPKLAPRRHYVPATLAKNPLSSSSHGRVQQVTMSTQREGPNPLRPYYIPPSVGPSGPQNGTFATNAGSKHVSTSTNSFGSSARNILADMDYTDYIPESSPSSTAVIKGLVEQAIWKYTSVFLAQPFEVAKTVLQAQAGGHAQKPQAKEAYADDMRRRPGSYRRESYEVGEIRRDYTIWLIKMLRCFLTMIRTLTLLPTSLPQHLSHRHRPGAHGHGEGMALKNQTVFPVSTRLNRLRRNHTSLRTPSTSSHLPQYWLYFHLIGRQKALGEYGKAPTALTSTRSFYPQSPLLSDRSSPPLWRYLTLVFLLPLFPRFLTPVASIYYLPLHRSPR